MKRQTFYAIAAVLAGTLFSVNIYAQGFSGHRAGKRTGVAGVYSNPANIATGSEQWSINIGSGSAAFAFNGRFDTDSVFNLNPKNNFLTKTFWEQFRLNMWGEIDYYGPGVSAKIGNGQAVALTTRLRAIGNIYELGGRGRVNAADSTLFYNGSPVQKLSVNGWKELGLSYAATLMNTDKHSLTAGATLKLIKGLGNHYLYAENLNAQLTDNSSPYLTNSNGRLSIGGSSNGFGKNKAYGAGIDIGFVYEKKNERKDAMAAPYKYRISASVLDVGAISYRANDTSYADYSIHIPATQRFMLNELEGKSTAEVKNYLDNQSAYFTNNQRNRQRYQVSLPATARMGVDVALNRFFFVETMASVSLVSRTDEFASFIPNYIMVTPRFERNKLALYLPVSLHEISGFNAGLSVRFGAFHIGSNSLFSLFDENRGMLDIHGGITLRLK